jgi:hypothetical protein
MAVFGANNETGEKLIFFWNSSYDLILFIRDWWLDARWRDWLSDWSTWDDDR